MVTCLEQERARGAEKSNGLTASGPRRGGGARVTECEMDNVDGGRFCLCEIPVETVAPAFRLVDGGARVDVDQLLDERFSC